MSQQQQQQERQQQRQRQERPNEESPPESSSQQRTADQTTAQVVGSAEKKNDMALEEARVTAGKGGARNLRVQWIDVQLPNADSCRFTVTTATGNVVEAVMEQKAYRQSYQGTSSLQTGIVPVATVGTKGNLTVRDLTTGELFEQPWTWRVGVRRWSLWALLKRWFT
jgi:hypothetical protein